MVQLYCVCIDTLYLVSLSGYQTDSELLNDTYKAWVANPLENIGIGFLGRSRDVCTKSRFFVMWTFTSIAATETELEPYTTMTSRFASTDNERIQRVCIRCPGTSLILAGLF